MPTIISNLLLNQPQTINFSLNRYLTQPIVPVIMDNSIVSDSQKTILIVDDTLDNLKVLSQALSTYRFQIRCAKSGEMALKALQTISPDLILLDIKMPDIDGYKVCQEIKSKANLKDIPIIFLSALDDVFDKVKAFQVGGADYITKPFQVEEVLIRINHQLELQIAKQEIQILNQVLEERVQQRTTTLDQVNQQLISEIKERKLIQNRLQQSEERLESILSSIEDVVWSMNPDSLELNYLNPSVQKIYNYSLSSFLENKSLWFDIIHPEDKERIKGAFQAMFKTGSLSEEYQILRPGNEVRWVSNRGYAIYDQNKQIIRFDGILRDITEQKNAEKQLIHNALHDTLTGLPNRILFQDRVEQAIAHNKRHPNYLFAVFFIDLDRFKFINDSLGHVIGDKFLQSIAKVLSNCLRSDDTLARFGGDEFTMLIDNINYQNEALIVADRILAQFVNPLIVQGHTIFTSASIGIVIGNQDYTKSSDLLRDADIAMYRSKELGKGRYTLFNQEMYQKNLKMITIENKLHSALEKKQFELYYQPIIALPTSKLVGFEALIRWHHPQDGLLSPDEFIPIAQETDLIVEIGDWVLEEACKQLQIWQTKLPDGKNLTMSINVVSKQLANSDILEKLDQILSTTGIKGDKLRLEITESTIMSQGENTIHKLEKLREKNILLSIDDFGQGYSSLSYLHHFPVNTLKIDRTFVSQMTRGKQNLEIIRTIILLAHILHLDVIAEGVETYHQVTLLRELGCEFAQGYFFSRPSTVTQIEDAIANQNLII